jgi:RNA polymerase sigma-70 factor (ECF subfamily)
MKNAEARDEMLRNQMVGLLPRLRRFAITLAKDSDRANDLVQAACERGLTRLDQLREGTRLDSWLYRIMYTQWIDKLRRKKTRSEKLILLSAESRSAHPGADMDNPIDAVMDLQNALNTLPGEHQVALMLVSVEGYSYAEAASVLDVPAGTVASRVARARNMLGRILFEENGKVLQPIKYEGREGRK